MIVKQDNVRRLQLSIEVVTCVQRHMEELEEKKRRSVTPAVWFEQEDHRGGGDVTKGWYF